ncbi:P-loop NTPase [Actinotalea subterranea]|uniref:nucleotide-binding protein n=1 Tax=Actinotalea subterranea TaxID=2607497 RepID=UPI0011EBE1BA|nr:ATP-binding protein [Actinotalea subterranea]
MTPVTVAVASGKGGTGKTLVATNLAAHVARTGLRVTLADCDVEAPNAHLFFDVRAAVAPVEMPVPEIVGACPARCTACRDACRFGAIRILGGRPVVLPDLCHGCGACTQVCPSGALHERQVAVGSVGVGRAPDGMRLVTGQLHVGQSKAPAVIRATREHALSEVSDVVLLDAAPGAACTAVAAVHGTDFLLLVTEPTPFGLHDLTAMVDLAGELRLRAGVVLNRVGTGEVDIGAYCRTAGVPLLASLPFDRDVAACYADGRLLIDGHPAGDRWFADLWSTLCDHLATSSAGVPA